MTEGIKFVRSSVLTGDTNTMWVDVTEEQVKKWEAGMLIQHAMPNITVDEREFIISGITTEEWNRIYGNGGGD